MGDVNVDICRSEWNPQTRRAGDIKEIPNFVQADGRYLPFRDETFEIVFSREAIEHSDKPFLFLSELLRVSNNEVALTTPHRLTRKRNPFHRHHFTRKWFDRAFRKLAIPKGNFRTRIIEYDYFPHPYFSLVKLPRDILVTVRKKEPFWKERI